MGYMQDNTEKFLREENERLSERLERQGYVLVDMLEKLEALEASCRELLLLEPKAKKKAGA